MINVMICISSVVVSNQSLFVYMRDALREEVTHLVPSQALLVHKVTRSFNTKRGTRPALLPLKM